MLDDEPASRSAAIAFLKFSPLRRGTIGDLPTDVSRCREDMREIDYREPNLVGTVLIKGKWQICQLLFIGFDFLDPLPSSVQSLQMHG